MLLYRKPARPSSRPSTLTGLSVRLLSSPSTTLAFQRRSRPKSQPHSHRSRFGRQLTRPLGDSNVGAHPTARDTLQLCHNEFPCLEGRTGDWTSPDDFALRDNAQRIPLSLVVRKVRQRGRASTNSPPLPILPSVCNTHSNSGFALAVGASSRAPTQ